MSDITYSQRAEKILREIDPQDSPLAQAAVNGELAKARAIREVDATIKYAGRLLADAIREGRQIGARKPGFFQFEPVTTDVPVIINADNVSEFRYETDELTRVVLRSGDDFLIKCPIYDVFDLAVGV